MGAEIAVRRAVGNRPGESVHAACQVLARTNDKQEPFT
jgi:hypothetical protein